MRIQLTSKAQPVAESYIVALRAVRPVLNGATLDHARAEAVANDATRIELLFVGPAPFDHAPERLS